MENCRDDQWQSGTIYSTMDGPRGTVHSAMDGTPAVATDGPGGTDHRGTIRSVTRSQNSTK